MSDSLDVVQWLVRVTCKRQSSMRAKQFGTVGTPHVSVRALHKRDVEV
jgi:hypothetical protein